MPSSLRYLRFLVLFCLLFITCPLHAENFYCQVMSVEGISFLTNKLVKDKPLQVGDILKADDFIEVGLNSSVDLSYDKHWKNVTRLESDSRVRIASIYPTILNLEKGSIYANLKGLPKKSSFEVRTPTAVAAARGTVYRTLTRNGGTEVFNFSKSYVYVFGMTENGRAMPKPVVIEEFQKTAVEGWAQAPIAPYLMNTEERQSGRGLSKAVELCRRTEKAAKRVAKIQDTYSVEKLYAKNSSAQMKRVAAPTTFYKTDSVVSEDYNAVIARNKKRLEEMRRAKEAQERVIPGQRGIGKKRSSNES